MRYAAVCRTPDRLDLHIVLRRLSAVKEQVFRINSDGFNGGGIRLLQKRKKAEKGLG